MTELPEWVKKYKSKGIEIRKFGNRYYAYSVSSKYDKNKKRARKITGEYLGVVTESGIFKKSAIPIVHTDYEYGAVALLYGIAEKTLNPIIKKHYPLLFERIIAFAILRLIDPLPLKSVRYIYEKTYLSDVFDETMSPESLSNLLWALSDQKSTEIMRELSEKGEYMLMDMTAIFSRSKSINIAEPGHNADEIHLPQINILLLFSITKMVPTFIRIVPGSIRDVSTLINTIAMTSSSIVILIMDKGFYSKDNIKELEKHHIKYIIPLRRDSLLRPELKEFAGVFKYEGRPIKYWNRSNNVIAYEDPELKAEEEKDYLDRINEGKRSRKEYMASEGSFGKLYLLSNVNDSPENIYKLYKQREYIEYAFNVFKNLLEADKTYLRDANMLSSYMFLNLLSLYLYFQVLNMSDGKYSVRDILLILSRIKIYKYKDSEILGEIPKKAKELVQKLSINLEVLRKK